jgi:sphingomyelin phosphodiesterase
LAHVNRTHKDIDYVIWTGDVRLPRYFLFIFYFENKLINHFIHFQIPPHDVWNQTRQGQVEIIREVAKVVSKYLGRIPIYPALGNHEGAPVNRLGHQQSYSRLQS